MTTVLHLSDTHFGTEIPKIIDLLRVTVRSLHPDLVVLSGDITQRARGSQFRRAREFLVSLGVAQTLAVPGNHDIPLFNPLARFTAPYKNYESYFGARNGYLSIGSVEVIGFDATSVWRHTRGLLEPAAVKARLAELRVQQGQRGAAAAPILMACIHQPICTALSKDRDEILIHHEAVTKVLSEYGVDVILSGHVHAPLITSTRELFPTLSRHIVFSGAGTAVSFRTRPGGPNSFNLLKIDTHKEAPRITVARYDYNRDSNNFEIKSSLIFDRKKDGW